MTASEFISLADPRWAATLTRCPHDLYHLPAYASLEGGWIGAEPIAFRHVEGDASMLLVLLERQTPSGRCSDVVTPYGYSSPVFSAAADSAFRRTALAAYDAAAQARGIVTSFMRLHPVIQPDLAEMSSIDDSRWWQTDAGVTVTMPLEGDETDFMGGVAHGFRADIRKLRASGASLVLDTPEIWSAFPGIYRATMAKVGATAGYFYSDVYLDGLRTGISDNLHCGGIVSPGGEIMCAALFAHVGDILQYHLSGTVAEFAKQAPMKLLLAEMRGWAVRKGVDTFHLGGGLGGRRDSLHAFKHKFGGPELPFRTVSIIHDTAAYARECAWQRDATGSDGSAPSGFFPQYRAPLVTVPVDAD